MTELLALTMVLASTLLILARRAFIKEIEGDGEHEISNE